MLDIKLKKNDENVKTLRYAFQHYHTRFQFITEVRLNDVAHVSSPVTFTSLLPKYSSDLRTLKKKCLHESFLFISCLNN